MNDDLQMNSRWALVATAVSVIVAIVLIIAKLIAWRMSGSAAVLGSLADSVLDLVGSLVAFAGVKWASEPADAEHRFGHNKAEAIAGLAQMILISGSALFVLRESVVRFLEPTPLASGSVAIGVMVLSLVLSLGLVAFQSLAIKRSGSLAVEGDRAHYTGDIIANAGTLLALVLSVQLGWFQADAIAGLLAAAFLGWSAVEVGRKAVPQLMDEELRKSDRKRIIDIVRSDEEVKGYHALRTRQAGNRVYIQLHLELEPDISLLMAHSIAERVEDKLLLAFPGADIILHQDPHGEDDKHDERATV